MVLKQSLYDENFVFVIKRINVFDGFVYYIFMFYNVQEKYK